MRVALIAAAALLALPVASRAADPAAGEKAFNGDLTCNSCHIPGEADQAPPLAGVAGRKVAGVADWPYCDALKARGAKGEVWDDKALDAFLTNTQTFAPGCTMSYRIEDAAKRADLIAYLKTLK
jgi:cytochrome c